MSKRQKISNQNYTQSMPPTNYEVPQESLLNFPSSIVNGITKENGLVSLTLKSVTSAKLVEEMTWFQDIIQNKPSESIRISEKDSSLDSTLSSLRKEIEELKQRKPNNSEPDVVEVLSGKLEESMKLQEKLVSLKSEVLSVYGLDNPNTTLEITDGELFKKVDGLKFDIKVDKKEDVKIQTDDLVPVEQEEVAVGGQRPYRNR